VATILILKKTHQKWFLCYHLPRSFKILINVFAFLYVKANPMEIYEEISFPSFLRKMLMSAFLLRFKLNYLKKSAWLSQFFFVDLSTPCKDLLVPHGPNLVQKLLYLVGSVLNTSSHV